MRELTWINVLLYSAMSGWSGFAWVFGFEFLVVMWISFVIMMTGHHTTSIYLHLKKK